MLIWEPWEKYKDTAPMRIEEIIEPPCKLCKYFSPRVLTNSLGDFDGVRMCVAEEMYSDFSCFVRNDVGNVTIINVEFGSMP